MSDTATIYKLTAARAEHRRIAEALAAVEAEQRRFASTGKVEHAKAARRRLAELRQDLAESKAAIDHLEGAISPTALADLLATNEEVPGKVAQIHGEITKVVGDAAGKFAEFIGCLEKVYGLGADASTLVRTLVLQLPPGIRERHTNLIEAAAMRDSALGAAFEDTLRRLGFWSELMPAPWIQPPARHDLPPMPEVAQRHAERLEAQVKHLVTQIKEGLRDE